VQRCWPLVLGMIALVSAAPVLAGPPYQTDDAEPTETGHWEIYAFGDGASSRGTLAGEAGLDFNYGGAEDLQLSMVIPFGYSRPDDEGFRSGFGDIELGAKYRFVRQTDTLPDISVFPSLQIPVGSSSQFTPSHVSEFLPVWAEKDFGAWSLFGGGGYDINPGGSNRNYWFFGAALTRQITPQLQLGIEVFHATADTEGGKAATGVGFGADYAITDHYHLIASYAPPLQNIDSTSIHTYYAALEFKI